MLHGSESSQIFQPHTILNQLSPSKVREDRIQWFVAMEAHWSEWAWATRRFAGARYELYWATVTRCFATEQRLQEICGPNFGLGIGSYTGAPGI
mmetsp:Transcript_109724/g.190074  ORF Transcript_109724/g.190074 Transcript_109724/m.190074 type:complete len:94 (+) Transcript_109724:500-781(+)